MIFYVLLTHGAKPTGMIDDHPAARQQIANLRAFRIRKDVRVDAIQADYQRRISGLVSLPSLSRSLKMVSESGSGIIVMDNLARLFAVCDNEARQMFLEELRSHGSHILGLQQGRLLSDMTQTQLVMLASGRETTRYTYGGKRPRNNMSKTERKEQTESATRASRKARALAADEKARELAELRKEFTVDDKKPTLKTIAEEANTRGITTTRGGPWSSSTVGRTLKRLDETPQTESDANDQAQE